ncbi:MAG: hypothetical protein IPM42_03825 [Saprospiraceae bacterium]|jgi:hypothetical protein|nr:hypothetical protein [Saprospiraceae bacterium]
MSSAGHIMDMLRRYEHNRSMQKLRRKTFSDKNLSYSGNYIHESGENEHLKKFSEEELSIRRAETFKAIRKERMMKNIYSWAITLLLILLSICLFSLI